jgi:hypothetical protein
MQTAANQRKQNKSEIPLSDRLVLTPKEFAQLFGHHPVWAYRLIYAQQLKVISDRGRIMIPRTEADKFAKRADFYNGK